jgi:hypothetical protein
MSGGSCLVVQWLPRMSRYYLEGIQKVAYVRWSHVRSPVRFAKRTSVVPSIRLHYRQQRTSVRPSVCPLKSPNYPSSVLSDPKPKLTLPTKLPMPS